MPLRPTVIVIADDTWTNTTLMHDTLNTTWRTLGPYNIAYINAGNPPTTLETWAATHNTHTIPYPVTRSITGHPRHLAHNDMCSHGAALALIFADPHTSDPLTEQGSRAAKRLKIPQRRYPRHLPKPQPARLCTTPTLTPTPTPHPNPATTRPPACCRCNTDGCRTGICDNCTLCHIGCPNPDRCCTSTSHLNTWLQEGLHR